MGACMCVVHVCVHVCERVCGWAGAWVCGSTLVAVRQQLVGGVILSFHLGKTRSSIFLNHSRLAGLQASGQFCLPHRPRCPGITIVTWRSGGKRG